MFKGGDSVKTKFSVRNVVSARINILFSLTRQNYSVPLEWCRFDSVTSH